MPYRHHIAALLLLVFASVLPFSQGVAQQSNVPPYQTELLRLSELVGSLHFLTLLCAKEDGDIWRERMQQLMEAEGKSELQRAKLTAYFNRGFDDLRAIHRKCSDSSRTIMTLYLDEADALIETITTRYQE